MYPTLNPMSSIPIFYRAWDAASTISLNQSVASLNIGGDLLEHFGLEQYSPTELHITALYGNVVMFNEYILCRVIDLWLIPVCHLYAGNKIAITKAYTTLVTILFCINVSLTTKMSLYT